MRRKETGDASHVVAAGHERCFHFAVAPDLPESDGGRQAVAYALAAAGVGLVSSLENVRVNRFRRTPPAECSVFLLVRVS